MTNSPQKLLIVRFSSFGDILQCLPVAYRFKETYPNAEVHWAVRSDFEELLTRQKILDKVWSLNRKQGIKGLFQLSRQLDQHDFTHIYDAHNNLRSKVLCSIVKAPFFIRRSKYRWKRFLLFKLGKNLFENPFLAQKSFIDPLDKWNIRWSAPTTSFLDIPQESLNRVKSKIPFENFVALIPGAAWPLKVWPTEHWIELIQSMPEKKFVLLGGRKDQNIWDIEKKVNRPDQVLNLAGQLSLIESCAALLLSEKNVSADTGLMHASDLLNVKTISLIGPTAFGYPSNVKSKVLEVSLPCKPCSKDGSTPCKNAIYQKCMRDILPNQVRNELLS